jgi:hypothetical protein
VAAVREGRRKWLGLAGNSKGFLSLGRPACALVSPGSPAEPAVFVSAAVEAGP